MPDTLWAGIPWDRGKETYRQKLSFCGTDSFKAFRSRSNSDHKNKELKAKYNVKILVCRSDRILPVVNESFFYQERKKTEWEKVICLQLWWYNTYIGVPVMQSFVNIPDKPKGQGVLTDSSCLNKAKMRTNSNSPHLLQSQQQDRWRKITNSFQPILLCLRFQQIDHDPEMTLSASDLVCCLWSMDLKWLLLSTWSVSWKVNWW